MTKQFVADLKNGDRVESLFVVASKNLVPYSNKSSKAGQFYLKLILKDKSGTIEGRIWDNALYYDLQFEIDDIVFVKGTVCKYNGLQITVHEIERVSIEEVEISDFIPTAEFDIDTMWEKLVQFINKIENPYINELLNKLFDNAFKGKFCAAPGGKKIHHAYRGGLLEHTVEVASIAENLTHIFPDFLNKDLLIAGALLHDIGKTLEYDVESLSFQKTLKGKLHGHLVLGRDILLKGISKIKNFPQELEDELGHMILSHHGCREWGSPETPKTIEALALFHADLTSARISQAAGTRSPSNPKLIKIYEKFPFSSF
ncbi:MAG TPA: metal-dependent phosphohydrolase [Peptococcaceae bacterium]|nr:MAG: 3'->5' exoribonuclease Bsu YhaM [Clostridia bacterium 41_269]HBT19912.1 metal-dependent phosphohydrolase [Peptococcaceae bacterium]